MIIPLESTVATSLLLDLYDRAPAVDGVKLAMISELPNTSSVTSLELVRTMEVSVLVTVT